MVVKEKELEPADAEGARAALRVGQEELERLREAFLNGEPGVEWAQVKSQEAVVEYAEAQIERLARQSARSAEALRQAALSEIAGEVDAYVAPEADNLVVLLKNVEDAVVKFAAAHEAHNSHLKDWCARAQALGVGQTGVADAANGGIHLPIGAAAISVGGRRLHPIYAGRPLFELLDILRAEAEGSDSSGAHFSPGYPNVVTHLSREQLHDFVVRSSGMAVE